MIEARSCDLCLQAPVISTGLLSLQKYQIKVDALNEIRGITGGDSTESPETLPYPFVVVRKSIVTETHLLIACRCVFFTTQEEQKVISGNVLSSSVTAPK